MRLMLGIANVPEWLVNVDEPFDPNKFSFFVVNGSWEGAFTNGYITVLDDPEGAISYIDKKVEILSSNQDRLRSNRDRWGDYETVFDNWDNPNYVAPSFEPVVFDDMDDDIPF